LYAKLCSQRKYSRPDESREELQDGYGDVNGGGDLGEVEQDLGEQLVHAVRHLQDARRQRHDTHLTGNSSS